MAFQFRIQLKNITKPPVWRRVVVPENISFLVFHEIIISAFGWCGFHLFQFSPQGYGSYPIIGEPDEYDRSIKLAAKVLLKSIFKTEGQKFTYIYDFGDDWVHSILLEKITPDKMHTADCLAGKGACPPEDCGGPWGYESLLHILSDPKHPEHKDMKEWLGLEEDEEWDKNKFDLEEAKDAVESVL